MTNTQHNWHVGMPIIMTADSGKGLLFVGYKNGDTRNGLIKHVHNDGGVSIVLADDTVYSFEPNSIGSGYPGMSIRPAEEKGIDESITPSQWIEGEITAGMPSGIYGFWHKDTKIKKFFEMGNGSQIKDDEYTHYIRLSQLPPPPPAAEVKAYGYLERMKQIGKDDKIQTNAQYREAAQRAMNFYSQPVTAEALNKYLISESKERWGNCDADITLDQFINWFKKSTVLTLLFTPAALKKLGVK